MVSCKKTDGVLIRGMQQKRSRMIHTMFFVILSLLWYPLTAGSGELLRLAGAPQYEFTLQDLQGRQRSLEEFRGKVVLVNFWASWCRPCIEEVPGIRRLIEALADVPFTVIGVNVGEAERRVQATVERFDMEFPILLDKDSTLFESSGATVLPTAFVLDVTGRVRYLGRGPIEWDRVELIELLAQLVQQPLQD